ncbi:MAG: asparagine synthase-related protein [Gaiellales bacterium]
MTHPLHPGPLEIAAGILVGQVERPPVPARTAHEPVEALREILRPALVAGRCHVTFSGGRDSSAILAVAAALAAEEGLAPPVPVTVRFANAPGTGELAWQERVVEHLGLDRWVIVEAGDELDLVGPVAQRHLRRHGVLYPANTMRFTLLAEHAQGGALVTGIGGDQLLGAGWLPHAAGALRGRVRPTGADLCAVVYRSLPRAGRLRIRRRHLPAPPWLRPDARAELTERYAQSVADEPLSYGSHRLWYLRRRSLAAYCFSVDTVAVDAGAAAVHPLVDVRFVSALAARGGRSGFGDRTATMRAIFSGVLPEDVLARESKAVYPYAYFREPSRAFGERWQGAGVDPDLVEGEALRHAWLKLVPSGWGALALQSAWVASEGAGQLDEEIADRGEARDRSGAA